MRAVCDNLKLSKLSIEKGALKQRQCAAGPARKLIILSSTPPRTIESLAPDIMPTRFRNSALPSAHCRLRSAVEWAHILLSALLLFEFIIVAASDRAELVPSATGRPDLSDDPRASGCDLLFSGNDNLANYCQCKDGEENPVSASGNREEKGANSNLTGTTGSTPRLAHISQLACLPLNFTQIGRDFAQLLRMAPSPSTHFQVDYLSIGTNLTKAPIYHEEQRRQSELLAGSGPLDRPTSLLIDHISLQLTDTSAAEVKDGRLIEEQMIDFIRLINETHLQFLSIFIEHTSEPAEAKNTGNLEAKVGLARGEDDDTAEIKFDRLLVRLPSLTRLELSLAVSRDELLFFLGSTSLQQQTRLKWLNLASKSGLTLNERSQPEVSGGSLAMDRNHSPFQWSPNIEYLSLESCNLRRFPLFSMFSLPFKFATTTFTKSSHNHQPHEFEFNSTTFYGMPNLNSLSLAGNKINSFERDFFGFSDAEAAQMSTICHNSKHDKHPKVFLLPLLTQLDLSHNKLSDLTFKVGQFILCTMPSLNQLYLQRNRIVQLNLNSLLSFPFEWPKSIRHNSVEESSGKTLSPAEKTPAGVRYSRLEYIDLSGNLLDRITGIQEWQRKPFQSHARIKSINLSHNRLKTSLEYIDPGLINTVVFEESFNDEIVGADAKMNPKNGLDNLKASFVVLSENSSTLCDFLSPENSSNNNELLNEVILSNNALERLTRKDFSSNQCKDVQILRISSNRITFIEKDSLLRLENLEQLDMSFNHIRDVLDGTFSKNSKLKVLNLSKNKIKHLNGTIFSPLSDLEELLIDSNSLTELETVIFARNTRLNTIDLSNNNLFRLESAIFSNLKELRILNINGNRLKQFSHHLFESLKNIILSSDNVLLSSRQSTSPIKSSAGQSKVKKPKLPRTLESKSSSKKRRTKRSLDEPNCLRLSSNQIDMIQLDNCAPYIQSIQILRLDDNKLESLSAISFNCLRSVRSLHLQSNRIRDIAEMTFSNMSELEFLDLSGNQIGFIGPRTLSFSSFLRHTNLNRNRLSSLKLVELFELGHLKPTDSSSSIESLDLSDNPNLSLDTADLIDFVFLSSIRELKMSNIKQIQQTRHQNQTAHQGALYLEMVNLSSVPSVDEYFVKVLSEPTAEFSKLDISNTFTSNDSRMRRLAEKPGLSELNLENNQLHDKLLAAIFKNMKMERKLVDLNLASNMIERWPFEADIAAHLSALKHLSLSYNKLRYFIRDESASYKLPELQVLNLSSNALIGLIEHASHRTVALSSWMPRLRELDLSNNRLTWLPAQFFQNLDELSTLRLSLNQLETLPHIVSNHRLEIDIRFNKRLSAILTDSNKATSRDPDDENLVLISFRPSTGDSLECQPIDDYVINYRREGPMPSREELLSDDPGEYRTDHERCGALIKIVDTFMLESIQTGLNINSGSSGRYTHLSIHKSGLMNLEGFLQKRDILVLDLRDNRIQDTRAAVCGDSSPMKSLDLSKNQLKMFPSDLIFSCGKLNYLDLSFNRISSIDKIRPSKASSIQVLKLNNNLLNELAALKIDSFKSLRLIELSHNRFKIVELIPRVHSSAMVITELEPIEVAQSDVPRIQATNDSLIFNWPSDKTSRDKYSFSIMQNGIGDSYNAMTDGSFDQRVKFCGLSFRGLTQVCVNFDDKLARCFELRIPAGISSCLTDLEKVAIDTKAKNESYKASSNSVSSIRGAQEKVDEEESVLQFINYLERNWLRLRDLNPNELLTSVSNISVDSVLFNFNGRYPVRTLVVMKWAIVISAISIVGLLIAMFMLLTRQTIYQGAGKANEFMNTADASDRSSSTNNKTSSSTDSDSSTVQASLLPTVSSSIESSSRTSKDDTQQQTVVERNAGIRLDANRLEQKQQACSTPSSSLAPSSIETAETMQAVDSIKSGFSMLYSDPANRSSVDQYTERRLDSNLGQQQPSQQVATVMRMIKSNSAHFDPSNHRAASNQLYGTSNAPRYSTLRSKICALHDHKQQMRQVYPVQVPQQPLEGIYQSDYLHSYPAPPSYLSSDNTDNMFEQTSVNYASNSGGQDQDPTTMSLISINTALSNCIKSSASQQVSPALITTAQEQTPDLCQYHRLVCLPSSNAIMEQEEPARSSHQHHGIPQPPPMRTLQVLENPIDHALHSRDR